MSVLTPSQRAQSAGQPVATVPATTVPAAIEPIIAEVVPPPPSPWRFGLKALLGLMAVCSVQFAAMNYLGVLGGLVAGMGVCFAVFSAIVLAGMALAGDRARLLAQLDALVVRLMLALVVLFLGSILAGGGTAAWQVTSRIRRERSVEKNLGMTLKEVQVVHDNHVVSALHITAIEDGGVAHTAGLQKDEVIVVSSTIEEQIKMLDENRGKSVDVHVATGALNKAVETCPQRSVTLAVPK